jgi:predicted TIM-barrel fold metal-dependent hydrolase
VDRPVVVQSSNSAGIVSGGAVDVHRAVDVALEAFGPQRLMYGSDWPLAAPGDHVRHRIGLLSTQHMTT